MIMRRDEPMRPPFPSLVAALLAATLLAALPWPQPAPAAPRPRFHKTPFAARPAPSAPHSRFRETRFSTRHAPSAISRSRPRDAAFAPHRIVVAFAASKRRGRKRSEATTQTRVLTLSDRVSMKAALARLRRRRGVLWAVPDYIAHAAAAEFIPNDPGASHLAGGWSLLQWNFAGPFGVSAPEAWANLIAGGAPGGRGVTVAVLDTGVAYENRGPFVRSPDFEASQFAKGYDFVAGSKHPDDRNGHGTFVAGAIAEATNNGRGLTGLAYGARIMPVRVLDASGEGDAATIARGVRFAVSHGAKVINLSLEFSGEVGAADVPELISALAYAHEHGVVIVAAAGNEGSTEIPYPARDRFAIAVGASTEHGCLADYSNYGRRIDLVAPGGGADADLPADPDCHPTALPGRDVYQETFTGLSPKVFGFPGGYEGTSMASPLAAATAALVVASGVLGPSPRPAAVRWRLQQTARRLGVRQDERDYGHGLLDAAAATATGGPGAIASRARNADARLP
jgi:serine protease